MSGPDDERMLAELLTMSRVYSRHGLHAMASQLEQLAKEIENRLEREKTLNNVVNMDAWSEEHFDERERRDG